MILAETGIRASSHVLFVVLKKLQSKSQWKIMSRALFPLFLRVPLAVLKLASDVLCRPHTSKLSSLKQHFLSMLRRKKY